MRSKRILFWLLCSMLPAVAHARGYKAAGCGLGSMIIKQDGFMQVFALTSNFIGYNQTFGITSGTSNCVPASKMAALKRQEEFFVANMQTIVTESSQGDGETLRAFAEVLGCSAEQYGAFSTAIKTNHGHIFSHPGAVATLEATKSVVRANLGENGCSELI